MRERSQTGCLFVNTGLTCRCLWDNGIPAIDIPGIDVIQFRCANARDLWDQLQASLYEVRQRWGRERSWQKA